MRCRVGETVVHYVEHGAGTPVLVLHGTGVDHAEVEACFEPPLREHGDLRRIYPDLPGMGRTAAPASLQSADDVVAVLAGFADAVADGPLLLVGHSAGAYYAQALADRRPDRVGGLALVCPLLADLHDVGEHRPVVAADDLGDQAFRDYFVVQTPAMLDRYARFVAPALDLVDVDALARIGEHWTVSAPQDDAAYPGPVLVVAGRQDSSVGYAAALDLLDRHPRVTVAVVDGAGHALPHEQPAVLAGLLHPWLSEAAPAAP